MKPLFWLLLLLLPLRSFPQQSLPVQTVKGTVTDRYTHIPLPGVTVQIDRIGAVTNEKGEFRINSVPVGRHTLRFSLMGYEPLVIGNVEVNAGKETVVEITLTENIVKLKDYIVTAQQKKGAVNPLAQVSARQLGMEEGMRYAGSRNDPSRMAQNFAGVIGGNDASNDIVIRGNSPNGVLYRMEGVDIPNPNHFSTIGASGGPVTILNTNTLRNSDFMTGAFPAPYGNALAGAFDLRLRNGNKDKYEFLAEVGFNGFEAAAEGPLGRPGNASFLLDYRYSTVAAIQALGLSVGTGTAVPYYQDLNLKLHAPTKNAGTFNLFALGGLSNIHFGPDEDTTGLYGSDNKDRDRKYASNTGVAGLTHSYNFNAATFGRAFVALSFTQSTGNEFIVKDGLPAEPAVKLDNRQTKTSLGYQLEHRLNARNQLSGGISADLMRFRLDQAYIKDGDDVISADLDARESTSLAKGWINLQHHFSDHLTANTGVYAQYLALNGSYSAEPRFNIKYRTANDQALSLGLGMHSQLQPLEVYFRETGGKLTNNELDFSRSLHAVLGYELPLSNKFRIKTEAYYQHLYNIPVQREPGPFSMLNTGAQFGFPDEPNLVNAGTGKNYGLELTLEKFLDKGFYLLFTQSLFNSKFLASDKVWRNTAFNSQYVTNFLTGREWTLRPGFNLGVDTKVSFAGGQWYTPFDVEKTIAKGYEVYDDSRTFSLRNNPYFRWDVKISFTWEMGRTTQKFFMDFQNVTVKKNIYIRRINTTTGTVSDINQIGFFPNVNYQFTF
ncbi:carboxypeptidase regulatory-like domain-containing protein [Chitinophaga sp. GCM10012297]|uniref:TonB-dependent receptor n=1 Tax=Chitinophaga chungangae TaxID=2821488 RepID=A0ABS3YAQ7_9BACT|nr:TonB-dependent receptor [Chitinophaga chungangae]MBO9151744.1 TonB-dependent receptor [Chitinophaga chungangae]